jgi:hypothetical protein
MSIIISLFLPMIIYLLPACDKNSGNNNNNNSDTLNVHGYGILKRLPGIWNGPVTSSTPLGSYPEWIVDFIPIGKSYISGKAELDRENDIFMSFFIAKYNNKLQMALRNGGGFSGLRRVSYMLIDSVSETATQSFYRFSDMKAGRQRVYTDVIFKADSMTIVTYTSKYNTVSPAVMHMRWHAVLVDTTSVAESLNEFQFPQKKMTMDFSETFTNLSETVIYNINDDPFPEYNINTVGSYTVNVSFAQNISFNPVRKVFLICTTQPLFNGFVFNVANMKFRSRYVTIAAGNTDFSFHQMHGGNYYLYALYDADDNKSYSSGDYISSDLNHPFSVQGSRINYDTIVIDFKIP